MTAFYGKRAEEDVSSIITRGVAPNREGRIKLFFAKMLNKKYAQQPKIVS